MTSWKEERDRLIKETMAFVEGVARRHPAAADIAKIVAVPPDLAPPEFLEIAAAEVIAHPPRELISDGDFAPASNMPAKVETPQTPAPETPALPPHEIYLAVLPTVPEPILTDLTEQDLRSAPPDQPLPSERTAIVSRVEAFKALQEKMSAERAAYYEATQERIKSALRNDAADPSSVGGSLADQGTGDRHL